MILETIVTTRARDGRAHIAPMGIRERDAQVVLAPFRPSTTLANVLASGTATLNLSDDVRVFAGCVTGRRDWPTTACEKVEGVRLEAALAHRELRLAAVEDDRERPRLICEVVHERIHGPFRGFNRAQAAVIEAAILVSRLAMLPSEKIAREIAYLQLAIDKTAGAREREAWGWLLETVAAYRRGAELEP